MKKNVILFLFLFISGIGFAQSYGSYCDTCVYQLSRDSLNRPAFQGGKSITPPIHKATMMMMHTKHYRDFYTLTNILALKASIDSVVTLSGLQTISGKKIFSDTITATKGIKSNGVIDTKGLNTEGSSTKAAMAVKGVQSEKDTLVSINFTLDGRYGTVGFDCTTGAKDCTFPITTGTTDWKFVVRKDDESTNELIIKTATGIEFYRLKSRMTAVFKNVNGTFRRIQ